MDFLDARVLNPEFYLPLLGALVAGSLIGVERGHRGQPAGFRTHALLCLTSAMLMVAANHQLAWTGATTPHDVIRIDPVRMSHGILTGVGFLGGGVIFREGFTVHGLTTAASIWITSALGILYGVGFWSVAIAGTILALLILSAFRLLDRVLPQQALAEVTIRYKREAAPDTAELRRQILELGLDPAPFSHRLMKKGLLIEHGATVRADNRARMDKLAAMLRDNPQVVEFEIAPRNH
ncbi:MAG TPA: MgtC/SapB family protein [Caulobacter sp.]|nr:MgtC/SapB family protein [Caulobacter sp.]